MRDIDLNRRTIFNIVTAALVLVVLVGWFFTLRPTFLGGPTTFLIVSGTSMEPLMESCDLAILHERDRYQPGDVIAYHVPEGDPGEGLIVIHRVIGGSGEDGYTTQGDNRDHPDRWHPRQSDVIGELWFHVPDAGCVFKVFRKPIVTAAFAGLVAALIVLEWGRLPWNRDQS